MKRPSFKRITQQEIDCIIGLLGSHADYTISQRKGWPHLKEGYPNLEWAQQIENEARTVILKLCK